jgi:hypothetical protein
MSGSDITLLVTALIVTGAGLYLTQRFIPHHRREPHNDVAGFIFAAVAVLYAVPLAFVVIAVWGNSDAARQTTFKEADALAGVYWISRQLPAPLGPQLEKQTLDYANTVIDTEWPEMSQHHTSSPAATALVYDIRDSVFAFNPATVQQQVLYEHAVSHVEDLASERRARLNQVNDEVPPMLWVVLIAGAVLTIGFTFLFGLSNTWAHILMVVTMTALMMVSLLVIKEMSYPYSGSTKVDPKAFEVFLTRLPPPR